jgi:hypothetical protein
MTHFSDLLQIDAAGRPTLLPGVHPLPDLLNLTAEQVLEQFLESQRRDFEQVIGDLENPENPLHRMFSELAALAGPDNRLNQIPLFRPGALHTLFLELHEHVMQHPVWRHPFFVRFFRGEFDQQQLLGFARQYFNQIKNTRQCVALAIGRFNSAEPLPFAPLHERVSELAQIMLAQLIADEYGVGSHSVEQYPSLHSLFSSTTHIVMYRQIFEGLEVPFAEQDEPMWHGVADNVLTQRLVAGHPDFSLLESLASVGLGMEWGVPEFFSLLLGGMIRWAWQHNVPLTQHHLLVLIAHVRYDVLHAISVMLITSFFAHEEDSLERIKGAVNTLMAARYGMMSDLYRGLFGEECAGMEGMDVRYHLRDRRIETLLREARARVSSAAVVKAATYWQQETVPFLFAPGI